MYPTPHSDAWYDRLATLQEGYFYPWRSILPAWHGEDVFRAMVAEHLRPDLDVLEVACAQGELTLHVAPFVRSVVAYDRVAAYIRLAQQSAQKHSIRNVTFLVHDSSADVNGGHPRLPVPDRSCNLLISSKGPFHWILDARRAARPGGTLLMLVPDAWPLTPWRQLLPEALRWETHDNPNWARSAIEQRLAAVQLNLHSWWSFDVPELLPTPHELYVLCSFGRAPEEIPSYSEAAPHLNRIFLEHAGPEGLEVRLRRYIWKAVIPREEHG